MQEGWEDLGWQGSLALLSQEGQAGRGSRRMKAWPASAAAASGRLPTRAPGCCFPQNGQSGSETPEATLGLAHLFPGSLLWSVQAAPLVVVLAKLCQARREEGSGGNGAEAPSGFSLVPSELTAHSTDLKCAPHPSPVSSSL